MNHNRIDFRILGKLIGLASFGMVLCLKLPAQNVGDEYLQLITADSVPTIQTEEQTKEQNNKNFTMFNLLFSGLLFENQKKKQTWFIPSLFELFPPNTVEGFVSHLQVSFTQHLQDGKFFTLKPGLRYGVGNKRFQAQLAAQFYYAPSRYASIQLSGGRMVEQFNRESTLNALNNTYYTYLLQENFLKIYQRSFVEIAHTFAPRKDFLLTSTISWNNRNPLQNLPKYQEEESEFTANNPVNDQLPSTKFEEHQALLWQVVLRWQLGHQLVRYLGSFKSISKYPAISLFYSGGVSDVLQSDVSYQKIALQVAGSFTKRKWGTGKYLLESGDFISDEKLSFMDFQHFNGQRTVYGDFGLNDFQLLDYYRYSTTSFYIQGHYEHQLNPLLLRKGRTALHPVVRVNYLYTPSAGPYWEFGVGLSKILKFWRLDFYNSWRGAQHERFGVRFGVIIN